MKINHFKAKLNININVFVYSKLIICYAETLFYAIISQLMENNNIKSNVNLVPTYRSICKIPNYAI